MKLSIREERQRRDWSQTYVAEEVGLTEQAIQKIETSQRKPSFAVLVQLEDLFQIDYRTLFDLPPLQRREVAGAAPEGANQEYQDQDIMDDNDRQEKPCRRTIHKRHSV